MMDHFGDPVSNVISWTFSQVKELQTKADNKKNFHQPHVNSKPNDSLQKSI